MTLKEIEIATAEQLADELAAACECTEDWERIPIEELRDRVMRLVRLYGLRRTTSKSYTLDRVYMIQNWAEKISDGLAEEYGIDI